METRASAAAATRPIPIVSVLVPAYDYAPGVIRILHPLLKEGRDDLEILVHDDSTSDVVARAIASLDPTFSSVQYARNSPPRGAVHNWNALLAAARGRYVLLMHHDDLPLSERFGAEIVAELERRSWPDALILTCVTHDVRRNRLKTGVCNRVRLLVARRWPMYLWRRNVIGPPAAIVVRRDLFDGYDPNLKWLVDVEAYYRFLAGHSRRVEGSRLVVVSSTGLPGAITTGIKDKRAVADAELAYASSKFPCRRSWSVLRGSTVLGRISSGLEWILWLAIKATSAACANLGRQGVSLGAVQRRCELASVRDAADPSTRAAGR